MPIPFPKPEPRPPKQPKKIPAKSKKKLEKEALENHQGKTLKALKPIRKVSAKQAGNLKAYEASKRERYANLPDVCESCGRNDRGISCSHLVARSHSFELVAVPANSLAQCFVCHEATESGRYFELKNGLKIMELLWWSLGDMGKMRFWKAFHQWPQNADLWKHSSFYNAEIHR